MCSAKKKKAVGSGLLLQWKMVASCDERIQAELSFALWQEQCQDHQYTECCLSEIKQNSTTLWSTGTIRRKGRSEKEPTPSFTSVTLEWQCHVRMLLFNGCEWPALGIGSSWPTWTPVFASVGTQLSTKKVVAIKKIKIGQFKDGLDMSAIREVKTLQELRHPNVIEASSLASTTTLDALSCYLCALEDQTLTCGYPISSSKTADGSVLPQDQPQPCSRVFGIRSGDDYQG